jgi:uncharacterized RDD family membrane protein YckC
MSDVSQGPGWWMASDGRWYPPHLHPSVINLPPPPPQSNDVLQTQAAYSASGAQYPSEPQAWSPPTAQGTYPPGYGPPPGAPLAPDLRYSDARVRFDAVTHLALAPWWKRLVAILIDGAVLAIPFAVIIALISALAGHNGSSSTTVTTTTSGGTVIGGFFVLFIFTSIPYMLYYGIMNGSRRGQTVGKMALGIAVRDARNGGPIGFWRAVGRYAITLVFDLLFFIPFFLDNLSPLWDSRRQAWHDKVVHSVVVDLRP